MSEKNTTHPQWDYIKRDLEEAVDALPPLTADCRRIIARKSAAVQEVKKATAAICEMCRSICGAVIDADHFILEGIDFAQILPAFREAHVVVAAAAGTVADPAAELVRHYGRNISMRSAILERFAEGDKEGAIKLMDAYTDQLIREGALE